MMIEEFITLSSILDELYLLGCNISHSCAIGMCNPREVDWIKKTIYEIENHLERYIDENTKCSKS